MGETKPKASRGRWGEDEAARHARHLGARILARNARGPAGEVDLILRHRGELAFVEVKTRRPGSLVGGLEAVTLRKQGRIARTAVHWMLESGRDPDRTPCRFDVMVVEPSPQGVRISWVEDAFQPGWA